MSVSPEVYIFVAVIATLMLWPMWWLTSKFFKRKSSIVIASLLGSLAVAPFLYLGLILVMLFSMHQYPSKKFDQDEWRTSGWRKEHGDSIPPTRFQYSEDLIERGVLIGKTRDDVIEMLGEGHESVDRLSYDLGFVPGHGIDPDFLEIHFENGVVVRVEQRRS